MASTIASAAFREGASRVDGSSERASTDSLHGFDGLGLIQAGVELGRPHVGVTEHASGGLDPELSSQSLGGVVP